MRKVVLLGLLAFILGVFAPPTVFAAHTPDAKVVYQPLSKPGEKIPLGPRHYFTYAFTKPPKLGTAVMRVEIFGRDGVHDTSFIIKGDADMPSMRGAHNSGGKDFSLSAKGDYLLPVRLSMPGDWEIRFTFIKEGKAVLRGAYSFDL